MSLTRVKDVDYLICMRLTEKDLRNFCRVNRYYNEIYEKDELWKRKIYELGAKYLIKNLNKSYFYELYNALKADFVKEIFLAIENDRADILYLIFLKKDIDPNYTFILDKYYPRFNSTCYYSTVVHDSNQPVIYSPVAMIIKKGSDVMWNIMKSSKYPLYIESYYILAIAGKNINILKDLLDYKMEIHSRDLYFALRSYNEEAVILLLKYVKEETIEQLLDTFFMETDPDYLQWIKVRNEAFAIFLLDERVKRNLGFFHFYNLQDNFSKLINSYL